MDRLGSESHKPGPFGLERERTGKGTFGRIAHAGERVLLVCLQNRRLVFVPKGSEGLQLAATAYGADVAEINAAVRVHKHERLREGIGASRTRMLCVVAVAEHLLSAEDAQL